MRKKVFILSINIILMIFVTSCGKKSKSVNINSLLSLVPSNVNGVFVVNVLKARNIDYLNNMINPKENDIFEDNEKDKKEYEEFVNETGIEINKNLNYIVAGIGNKTGVVLVNIKYDKEKLLNYLKKKKAKLEKIDYKNKDFYKISEKPSEKNLTLAFLDNNLITMGDKELIKKVIDLYDGGKDSVLKNKEVNDLLNKANRDGILWGAFKINPNLVKQKMARAPFDTSKITAIIADFDYLNNALEGKIKVLSNDSANNKKIADMLNGLKAMAMGNKKTAKFLEKLNFVSAPDSISLVFSLPQELLNQLKEDAKVKAKDMLNKKSNL